MGDPNPIQSSEGQRTFLHFPTTSDVQIDPSTLLDVNIGDAAELEYFFEEMKRCQTAIVMLQGEDGWFLPRKKQGTRCTFWKAEEEQCERPLDPRSTCYNTGWIGGYHDPMLIKVVVPPAGRTATVYEEGVRREYLLKPWTIYPPRLNERDVFVQKFTGLRFEILNVSDTLYRGLPLHQEFDFREIPHDKESYTYSVAVPPPLP